MILTLISRLVALAESLISCIFVLVVLVTFKTFLVFTLHFISDVNNGLTDLQWQGQPQDSQVAE